MSTQLTTLDIEAFNQDMLASSKHFSGLSNTGGSTMTSRFEDTTIQDTDVILTTKASDQVRILLGQLVNSTNFSDANFDMSNSTYFMKHYDVSMQAPFRVGEGHESA